MRRTGRELLDFLKTYNREVQENLFIMLGEHSWRQHGDDTLECMREQLLAESWFDCEPEDAGLRKTFRRLNHPNLVIIKGGYLT